MSVTSRLNRLFASDGNCFDLAIDHGFFNEMSFLSGIENMEKTIEAMVTAGPDAIQLSPGQAPLLQQIAGAKPALVFRADVANVYASPHPSYLFNELIDDAVGQAVRLDAACVVVNVIYAPEQPQLHHQCLANVGRLKPACTRSGMPLMVEPLVMQVNERTEAYAVDGDIQKIIPLVRQAIELGADIIKADPSDDLDQYHRVVEAAAGKPVLPRGGGKVSEEEVFSRTYQLMQQGASGIVYGQNVIQHAKPQHMVSALMAIVHDGVDVARAQAILGS